MDSVDKIEKAPENGGTSNPLQPDISVKEEEFFKRDTGPYDVNQQTLSDIERDIADLEEARDIIKKKLKVKKPGKRLPAVIHPDN